MGTPMIIALMPAFNEEIAIGSMVLRTMQHVDDVLVIDDGSSDHTAEVATLAGAKVIRHSVNLGKGAALKSGFSALKGPEIVVTIDSDGQHNPDDIPKLVAPIIADEADLVNGSRYINGNRKDTPIYRRLGQVVLDKATNLDSGLMMTDTQSGFRAFGENAKSIFRFKQNGLAIESEMLADAARAGLRIKEVEIGVRYDVDGSSEHPIRHGIKVFVKILQDIELKKPLYYFTVPGIAIFSVGFMIALDLLKAFYGGASMIDFFGVTLLMIVFLLIGTFMAFTGIVLHSISRMIENL